MPRAGAATWRRRGAGLRRRRRPCRAYQVYVHCNCVHFIIAAPRMQALHRALCSAPLACSALLRAGARPRPAAAAAAAVAGGARRGHCDEAPAAGEAVETVSLDFAGKAGTVRVRARVGASVLAAARAAGVDLEGACECSLACSTCHVVLPPALARALPPPTDEEEDLLDLAFALTPTSRLGCQVRVSHAFDGATVTLPAATRNLYVDGHVPKPH